MKPTNFSLACSACLLMCLFAGTARADAVTISFDELPDNTPINNVSLAGVTFGFSLDGAASSDARFRQVGPRNQTYVQCPCLEGTAAGTLTLDFAQPTARLSFGIARVTNLNVIPGATIQLFDVGASLLSTHTIDLLRVPPFNFPEGLFSYTGAPVSRTVITFDNPLAGLRFALDNVMFEGSAAPVPEPATLLLLGTGLAVVAVIRRRYCQQS